MPVNMKIEVIDALKKVIDPEQNKDIVTLNQVKNVTINDNDIKVDLILNTTSVNIKDKIEKECLTAIKNDVADVRHITINITSKTSSTANDKKKSMLPGVKNTIAVASGKGGVGKSTVAVNLAVALAKNGAKVGLIDADIYGPSIPLMLGIKEKPQIYQNSKNQKMIPLENYGIKLMSIGFLIDDNQPVIWRGPMASGAVKQFLTDVDWDELDYLVFDMPPGTGDIQLTLVQTLPLTGAVIVTTPQEVSIIDAKKGVKMFQRVNVPILGIVENMSFFIAPDTGKRYDIFGEGGGLKLAKEMNVPYLGGIPIDSRIRIGGDTGKPIVYDIPDSEHAKIITDISNNFVKEVDLINDSSKNKPKVEILL